MRDGECGRDELVPPGGALGADRGRLILESACNHLRTLGYVNLNEAGNNPSRADWQLPFRARSFGFAESSRTFSPGREPAGSRVRRYPDFVRQLRSCYAGAGLSRSSFAFAIFRCSGVTPGLGSFAILALPRLRARAAGQRLSTQLARVIARSN